MLILFEMFLIKKIILDLIFSIVVKYIILYTYKPETPSNDTLKWISIKIF